MSFLSIDKTTIWIWGWELEKGMGKYHVDLWRIINNAEEID